MATLTVQFNTSGFSYAAKRLGSSLDDRIKDYSGIRKDIQGVSNSSNITSASSYLQKKISQLEDRKGDLDRFRQKAEAFCKEAKTTDQGVAKRIQTNAKKVYKTLGIKTGLCATIAGIFKKGVKAIVDALSDVWKTIKSVAKHIHECIKEWYQKNKWWIEPVLAIVGTIAAILLIVAAFASGVGWIALPALLAKILAVAAIMAKWDAIVGLTAFGLSLLGKWTGWKPLEDGAAFIKKGTFTSLAGWIGSGVDWLVGNEDGFYGSYLSTAVTVIELASIAEKIGGGLKKIYDNFMKEFKLSKLKTWDRWDPAKHFTKENTLNFIKKSIGWTKGQPVDAMNLAMNKKYQFQVLRNILQIKDLKDAWFWTKTYQTVKNVKAVYDIYNDMKTKGVRVVLVVDNTLKFFEKLTPLFNIKPAPTPTPLPGPSPSIPKITPKPINTNTGGFAYA